MPPSHITILDDQGAAVIDHTAGPYQDGASINLTCISSGGKECHCPHPLGGKLIRIIPYFRRAATQGDMVEGPPVTRRQLRRVARRECEERLVLAQVEPAAFARRK